MAHIAGKAGEVKQAGGEVLGIKSWSCDYTVEALNTTDFADVGVSTFIAGPSQWAGSFEGFKDGVAPAMIGTIAALSLMESQTAGQLWTGNALITGWHSSTPADGIVEYSYDFQGTGALTVPTA